MGGAIVGFALSCEDGRPLATVYLGPFPLRLQALQLATRTAGGAVTRFGPAFRADAASGFHSPQLAGDDLDGFLRAVLAPGTLVSNGYSSYRVQLTSTGTSLCRTIVSMSTAVPSPTRTATLRSCAPGRRLCRSPRRPWPFRLPTCSGR